MTRRFLVLALILMLTAGAAYTSSLMQPEGPEDVKVLSLISDGFGWNFFDTRDKLEAMGVTVDTVAYALDYEIDSCYNRAPRPITADYLVSDVTQEILTQYHALFIPAGGQWHALHQAGVVQDFISDAYELGLVIAAMCIAQTTLACANDIISGSKLAYFGLSWEDVTDAGGIPIFNSRVVSHNRFITGGAGGGYNPGDGYLSAPSYMVAVELVRECLGYSRVEDISISPVDATQRNFTIQATLADLSTAIPELNSTDIESITAFIYVAANHTEITSFELTDEDEDGTYSAEIDGLEEDVYTIDFEIFDSAHVRDVESDVGLIRVFPDGSVTTTTTTSTTTQDGMSPVVLGGIALSGVAVLVIAVVASKRR
ncbi:MAG: hypothetical protein EAX95_14675 [Candidatus Thorarchaeota archaeon]|nr:hypothetical protein [Candidatus Thorarchaeota archaeon]